MTRKQRLLLLATCVVAAAGTSVSLVETVGAGPARSKRQVDFESIVQADEAALGVNYIKGVALVGTNLDLTLDTLPTSEATVARWFGKVLAANVAQQLKADGDVPVTTATYHDQAGTDFNGGPDSLSSSQAPNDLAPDACATAAASQADAAGAAVKEARTIMIGSGACYLVLQPTVDVATFAESASSRLGEMLSAITNVSAHAYLAKVVDQAGTTRLVVGWTPAIGGEIGQGLGWVQPGLSSSAVLGPS